MSIERRLDDAREVDIFSALSPEEKLEADLLAEIAVRLRRRRDELGMTQIEFARLNNVTQAMVSKWESGEYNFTVQTLAKVFSKIGLSLTLSFATETQPHTVLAGEQVTARVDHWSTRTTLSREWSGQTASAAAYAASK